jgi:ssDNA-binding Zn-finger/Zn-ribbon topoisomerase 1
MVKVSSSKEKIKCPKCGKKMKMKKLEPVWDLLLSSRMEES